MPVAPCSQKLNSKQLGHKASMFMQLTCYTSAGLVPKWADPPMLQALVLWDVNATSLTCSLDDCPAQMRIFLDFPTLRRIEVEYATLADCQNGRLPVDRDGPQWPWVWGRYPVSDFTMLYAHIKIVIAHSITFYPHYSWWNYHLCWLSILSHCAQMASPHATTPMTPPQQRRT